MNETVFNSRLGALLQEAREKRDMSLSDVAGITHVRKEYLQAIDEGRWNDLPENVYTRNFLRLYASTVGIDEHEALSFYAEERYGKQQRRSSAPRPSSHAPQAACPSGNVASTSNYAQPKVQPNSSASAVRDSGVVSTLPATASSYSAYTYGRSGESSPSANAKPKTRRRFATTLLTLIIVGSLGVIGWQQFIHPEAEIVQNIRGWYEQQTWLPWLEAEVTPDTLTLTSTTTTDTDSTTRTDATNLAGTSGVSGTYGVSAPSSSAALSDANAATSQANVVASDIPLPAGTATPTALGASDASLLASSASATSATATFTIPNPDSVGSDQIFLTIRTEPTGAIAYLDDFELGTTPIENFPAAPANSRLLRIDYEGYESIEEEVVLVFDRNIFYELDAIAPAPSATSATGLEGEVTATSANPASLLANTTAANIDGANADSANTDGVPVDDSGITLLTGNMGNTGNTTDTTTDADASGNTDAVENSAFAAGFASNPVEDTTTTGDTITTGIVDGVAEGAEGTRGDVGDNAAALGDTRDTSSGDSANSGDNATQILTSSNGGGLRLEAREDVWLEVYTGEARNDGERLAYQLLQAGEVLEFSLPAFVHAGNSQALQVSVNGVSVGVHGDDVVGKRYP